jgi:hypothetical protein
MGDDADHSASDGKAFDRACCRIERFGIECSESFVNEQAVERYGASRLLHLLAQLQGERQRRKKSLSPAEGICATQLPGVLMVYDIKRLVTPLKPIPPCQVPQTLRGASHQLAKSFLKQEVLKTIASEVESESPIY